ncbi:MAG: OmpA family protein [Pseudomonadota bacterium]
MDVWFAGLRAGALVLSLAAGALRAETAESYVPTIWIDPDGCEHWVMDDGIRGYMDAHLDRNGHPVCHRDPVCGVVPTDQLFATGSAALSASGRARLLDFFAKARGRAVIVSGHTDATGSDEANMRLSQRRADAVAAVARKQGKPVLSALGYGERWPRASNATVGGRKENRRVEIICVQ